MSRRYLYLHYDFYLHIYWVDSILYFMIEKMTIEDLAEMVKHGFDATATKEDVQQVATDLQVFRGETNTRLDHLDARTGRIEADIHELQEGVVYRHEFEDVLGRIKYIERKLGIESGV